MANRDRHARPGQSTIELVLMVSIILIVLVGIVATGRITQGHLGVLAVAREVARAAALGQDAGDAERQGLARGLAVAQGYGLTNGTLVLAADTADFRPGGQVRATVTYRVTLGDLPLLRTVDLTVQANARELVPQHMTVLVDR